MTSFSNISGAGFASVRMGKKNYVGQSTVRYIRIFFFFNLNIYLFIWPHGVLVAAHRIFDPCFGR